MRLSKTSKTCLREHNCLCIVVLLLSCLLKYNWRLIIWLKLMKQQFKDKNCPFTICCVFSRLGGRGMKTKNNKKWPEIFLIFQSLNPKKQKPEIVPHWVASSVLNIRAYLFCFFTVLVLFYSAGPLIGPRGAVVPYASGPISKTPISTPPCYRNLKFIESG